MEKFQSHRYVFSNLPSILEVGEEAVGKREKQINLLLEELNNYRIVLKDLIIYKPNIKTKNLLLNVAYFIVDNVELLDIFKEKKELPVAKLGRFTKLPQGFLEKWEDYIVMYCLILSNPEYGLIQDYLKIEYLENYKEVLSEETDTKSVKGLVIQINKRNDYLLTSNGELFKVERHNYEKVGDEHKAKEKRGLKHFKLEIGVFLLLLAAIGFLVYKDYSNPVSTILIQSTSQIKIQTNKYDKVVYAFAESEKGKAMLKDTDYLDKNIDNVLKSFIKYANTHDMITEDGLVITVTGDPIKYGTLEKTGKYIVDNNVLVLINNSGVQQKLSLIIRNEQKENKKSED